MVNKLIDQKHCTNFVTHPAPKPIANQRKLLIIKYVSHSSKRGNEPWTPSSKNDLYIKIELNFSLMP